MNKLCQLLFLAITVALFSGCNRKGSFEHSFLLEKNKRLFVEFYRSGLIGNMTSMYLTDSTHFRLYLGTYDPENELIHVKIKNDSIITQKKYGDRTYETAGKIISEKLYNLPNLIKDKKFD